MFQPTISNGTITTTRAQSSINNSSDKTFLLQQCSALLMCIGVQLAPLNYLQCVTRHYYKVHYNKGHYGVNEPLLILK